MQNYLILLNLLLQIIYYKFNGLYKISFANMYKKVSNNSGLPTLLCKCRTKLYI